MSADQLILLALNALTGIALLVIVSLGIAVTVGMMGVINLAHGELVMVGAYTVLVLTQQGLPLLLAMLMAPVVAGLVGWAIERLVIRWLYGRVIDTLLATAGISMFLIQVARILCNCSGGWGISRQQGRSRLTLTSSTARFHQVI